MKHIKTVAALLVAILISTATLFAQTNWSNTDSTWFRHYAIGVSAGTNGVGVSAAVMLGNHLQIRGGYSWFPETGITVKKNVSMDTPWDIHESIPITFSHTTQGANVFLDYYPNQNATLHFTAGLVATNGSRFYGARTNGPLPIDHEDMGTTGYQIRDRLITTDPDGYGKVYVDIRKYKPYIGIGSGHNCSKLKRVVFNFDAGIVYTGGMRIYSFDWTGTGPDGTRPAEVDITATDLDNIEDEFLGRQQKQVLRFMNNLPVLLHLQLTMSIRLF